MTSLGRSAGEICDKLFSELGYESSFGTFRWLRDSKSRCFPGVAEDQPMTIQTHNHAIRLARAEFAEQHVHRAPVHRNL